MTNKQDDKVTYTAPSRRDKKILNFPVDAAAKRQLQALQFKHQKSQQDLLWEALDLLFAKYGEAQIAVPSDKRAIAT